MKKSTIVIGALCAAVVIIGGIVGVTRWRQQQEQETYVAYVQSMQEQEAYVEGLELSFELIYDAQNTLLADITAQRQAGVSDLEIVSSAIATLREPINELAALEAPEHLADVQSHFAAAAESCNTMADEVLALMEDPSLSSGEQQMRAVAMLPTALSALNELKEGIAGLSDNDIAVPEYAEQLVSILESLTSGDFSNIAGS